MMREVTLRQAKSEFSDLVDRAVAGEPQVVTRHGKPAAVVISYEEWERLSAAPSLGWLLGNFPLDDGDIPERNRKQGR